MHVYLRYMQIMTSLAHKAEAAIQAIASQLSCVATSEVAGAAVSQGAAVGTAADAPGTSHAFQGVAGEGADGVGHPRPASSLRQESVASVHGHGGVLGAHLLEQQGSLNSDAVKLLWVAGAAADMVRVIMFNLLLVR